MRFLNPLDEHVKTWVQEVRKSIYGILSYKHLKFLKYCKKWPTCSNNLKLGQYVANIIRINLTY